MATSLGKRASGPTYRKAARTGWNYRGVPTSTTFPHSPLWVAKIPPRSAPQLPRLAPPPARRPAPPGVPRLAVQRSRRPGALAPPARRWVWLFGVSGGWSGEAPCPGRRLPPWVRRKRPGRGGWTSGRAARWGLGCSQRPGPPGPEDPSGHWVWVTRSRGSLLPNCNDLSVWLTRAERRVFCLRLC